MEGANLQILIPVDRHWDREFHPLFPQVEMASLRSHHFESMPFERLLDLLSRDGHGGSGQQLAELRDFSLWQWDAQPKIVHGVEPPQNHFRRAV